MRAVPVMKPGRRSRPALERQVLPAVSVVFATEDEPGKVVCSGKSCVICAYHREKIARMEKAR